MTRLLPTKWFRLAPILLVALIAVLSVWPRPAGASPCKPDGQACRTNQSCCGTNGHNGLCVNSNPPGKRPAGACCTPTTCEAAGAHCGMIADGTCLTLAPLNCGTCPDDEICTAAHVCETTSTTTTTTTTTSTTTTTTPSCTPACTPPDECVAVNNGTSCEAACHITCNNGFVDNSLTCNDFCATGGVCQAVCDSECAEEGRGGCATAVCTAPNGSCS